MRTISFLRAYLAGRSVLDASLNRTDQAFDPDFQKSWSQSGLHIPRGPGLMTYLGNDYQRGVVELFGKRLPVLLLTTGS